MEICTTQRSHLHNCTEGVESNKRRFSFASSIQLIELSIQEVILEKYSLGIVVEEKSSNFKRINCDGIIYKCDERIYPFKANLQNLSVTMLQSVTNSITILQPVSSV